MSKPLQIEQLGASYDSLQDRIMLRVHSNDDAKLVSGSLAIALCGGGTC